ncbi:hypothetical protein D3C73_1037260 [compost metagenome]
MIQDVHQDSGLILQVLEQQRVGIDFILLGLFLDEVRHQRQLGTYTARLNLLKIIEHLSDIQWLGMFPVHGHVTFKVFPIPTQNAEDQFLHFVGVALRSKTSFQITHLRIHAGTMCMFETRQIRFLGFFSQLRHGVFLELIKTEKIVSLNQQVQILILNQQVNPKQSFQSFGRTIPPFFQQPS